MRPLDRIDVTIEALHAAWSENPDLRLTQVIFEAARRSGREVPPCPELFHMEDDQMLEGLEVIAGKA